MINMATTNLRVIINTIIMRSFIDRKIQNTHLYNQKTDNSQAFPLNSTKRQYNHNNY